MTDPENSITADPTLIIGLGGTGVKVAQRLKKQLLEKSPQLLAEGAVSFFCLDTEPYSKERHDSLTEGEYMSMGIGVNPQAFVNASLSADGNFGIKTVWPVAVDTYGLPYELHSAAEITMGASMNRLVGRVAFFADVRQIYTKIQNLISNFFRLDKVGDDLLPLHIHIVSSLAGGTGSALIFDVPYLVKLAAERTGRFVDITGHFVMAEVFLSVLPEPSGQTRTKANTYTCLKEIDHLYRKRADYDRRGKGGQPLWEVRYTDTIGTVDADGMPNEVARELPMDWIHLYDRTNEAGMGVSCPHQMFDIIAQGISCTVISGIMPRMMFGVDEIRCLQLRSLSSRRKAKPYSSMGVSTLELPIKSLQEYLGYKWAEQLARLKADHPYQSQDTEEAADKWALMKQCELFPLQELVLTSCPVFRLNSSNGKLEETEGDNELRQNWPKLAEEFGLVEFDHKYRADISEAIARNYDQRVLEGKSFLESAENAFEKYQAKIKLAQKDHLTKVKAALSEKLASLVDYSHRRDAKDHNEPILRSMDAFSHAIGDLQRALGRVINVIAAEQQKLDSKQMAAEKRADPERALKESKISILGFGGRSGQISDWSEAVKVTVDSKAEAEKTRLLRSALEELREYLKEEIKFTADDADCKMTAYVHTAKSKAYQIIDLAKRDEAEKVASGFLIRADDFPAFAASKTQVLEEKAEEIWRRTDELIREGGNSLIGALAAGRTRTVLGGEDLHGKPGCLEEACLEAAKEQLAKLDFQQFAEDTFLSKGGGECEFRNLVMMLMKKAEAWAGREYVWDSFADEVQRIDYLLYPKGAESIGEILEKMNQDGEFRERNLQIVEMPKGVAEGIVKISMRLGYPLEALKAMGSYKACEMAMLESPFRMTILKNYDDYRDPMEVFTEEDESSLGVEDYFKAGRYFVRAHYYKVIELQYSMGDEFWEIKYQGEFKDTLTERLPGERKVRMPQPTKEKAEQGEGIGIEIATKLWAQCKDEKDCVIKIGAILMNDDIYRKLVESKDLEHNEQNKGNERTWLDEYYGDHLDKFKGIDREYLSMCLQRE